MEKNLPLSQKLHIETGAGTGGQHGAFEGGREGLELFHHPYDTSPCAYGHLFAMGKFVKFFCNVCARATNYLLGHVGQMAGSHHLGAGWSRECAC
jgi:hypothetical protein